MRDPFDEQKLIDAVSENAEPEQRQNGRARRERGAADGDDDRQDDGRERNARPIVGQRLDERGAEFHDAEIHAPHEGDEHE